MNDKQRSDIAKMPQRPGALPHPEDPLVCLLAYDGLCTFEFGIGVEIFALPRPDFDRWYAFKTVGIESGPLRAVGGFRIDVSHGLEALAAASLIVIPGWRGLHEPVPSALVRALRQAHANGARLASFCSGCFVLAATGLLNGRRATTHWRHAPVLQDMYPEIRVEPDVLYIDNGDVMTSAGSAAAMDLGLHIVRKDFGARHANTLARGLVIPALREGGQQQFIDAPKAEPRTAGIGPLLDRLRTHLDEDWPLTRMASEAGLSLRTLIRRFHEETGQPPQAWLKQARVDHACLLLEGPAPALADVAAACGFNSQETFRRDFRRLRGISPSQHRRSFAVSPG